uniref:hypothetical protein n=1 Tax=Nonomuraea bangladeshensis TaxID=404385 RepID=UPI003F49B41D
MRSPDSLLDLGLTLREEQSDERRRHVGRLASRLGFAHVWLPIADGMTAEDVAAVREVVRPGRLGLVVAGNPKIVVDRVTALRVPDLEPGTLVEIHAPAEMRDPLVTAAGGPAQWRERVVVPWYDAEAAGLVLLADQASDREAVMAALAQAASRRVQQGDDLLILVALTVSIGRTMSEAEARALRDPALCGERHPRIAGLFGTLENAQAQALDLARAGVGTVRATLADEHDIADLLAQLRSVAVGPTSLLHAQDR